MNRSWRRLIKLNSRKEPISNFILMVGTVDTVIGGVSGQASLLLVGLTTIGVAILLRQRLQRRQPQSIASTSVRSLPPASAQRLPNLKLSETQD